MMTFPIRPRLLLETRLVLEQMQSNPQLVLETRPVFETLLASIRGNTFFRRHGNRL